MPTLLSCRRPLHPNPTPTNTTILLSTGGTIFWVAPSSSSTRRWRWAPVRRSALGSGVECGRALVGISARGGCVVRASEQRPLKHNHSANHKLTCNSPVCPLPSTQCSAVVGECRAVRRSAVQRSAWIQGLRCRSRTLQRDTPRVHPPPAPCHSQRHHERVVSVLLQRGDPGYSL